eukprot:335025-Amphidinium_carterae.1
MRTPPKLRKTAQLQSDAEKTLWRLLGIMQAALTNQVVLDRIDGLLRHLSKASKPDFGTVQGKVWNILQVCFFCDSREVLRTIWGICFAPSCLFCYYTLEHSGSCRANGNLVQPLLPSWLIVAPLVTHKLRDFIRRD